MKRPLFFACSVIISIMCCSQGIASSTAPEVIMPDGIAFEFWENTTKYSHTYYVDKNHPRASDTNSGSSDAPFLTINRAAQVVKSGERILIKSGVYREKVIPINSGSGPDRMISYEASPGARVIIKGSKILEKEWTR